MRGTTRALHALLALGVGLAPSLAQACAVCMGGREDDTRLAFLISTGFMSVLPLAVIGGLVWWLVRRARAREREALPAPAPALSRASSSR